MRNFSKTILFSIFVIFLISCNKDDNQEIIEAQETEETSNTEIPSEFTITVEPAFSSVQISWTNVGGENNQNLKYAIYLDNLLVEENIIESNYEIQNLTYATSYSLRIIAKNEIGVTEQEILFQTLNPIDYFLLKKFGNLLFEYSSDRKIILANEGDPNYPEQEHAYDYDEQGNLIYQLSFVSAPYQTQSYFEYSNDQLQSFRHEIWDGFVTVRNRYNYIDPNTIEYIKTDDYGYYASYLITLQKDSENRVTNYKITNDSNQSVNEIEFVYSEDNLTKINELTDNNIWEIEYDTNFSYITYNSYQGPILNSLGIPGLSSNLNKHISNIFDFISYKNNNNPVKVLLNGEIHMEISYEYNEFDFPSRLTRSNGYIRDLEYINK